MSDDFEVAKPFNTASRRLKVGTPITESDDLMPFTFSERLERGFIKSTGLSPAPTVPVEPPKNLMGGGVMDVDVDFEVLAK